MACSFAKASVHKSHMHSILVWVLSGCVILPSSVESVFYAPQTHGSIGMGPIGQMGLIGPIGRPESKSILRCPHLEWQQAELVAVFGDGAAGDLDAGVVQLPGDLAVGEALRHEHPNHLLRRER